MSTEPDPENFDELMEALPWKLRGKILSKLRGEELPEENEATLDDITELFKLAFPTPKIKPIERTRHIYPPTSPEAFADEMREVFRRPPSEPRKSLWAWLRGK